MISGSNNDARRNPFRPRRRGGSCGSAVARGERAPPHAAAPSSVSAGRRRPKVAVADGRERTRRGGGRRWHLDAGGRPGQRWRTDTKTGRASRREEEAPVGRKEPVSSVSYVVSVESDGKSRASRCHWGPTAWTPRREGTRAEPHALFSCPLSVCAPRSIRALSCSSIVEVYRPRVSDSCLA